MYSSKYRYFIESGSNREVSGYYDFVLTWSILRYVITTQVEHAAMYAMLHVE